MSWEERLPQVTEKYSSKTKWRLRRSPLNTPAFARQYPVLPTGAAPRPPSLPHLASPPLPSILLQDSTVPSIVGKCQHFLKNANLSYD